MDNKLNKALSERTLIFDGAMGTELYKTSTLPFPTQESA